MRDELERDELIDRVTGALRALPPANAMATARIVARVRARRQAAPSRLTLMVERMRETRVSLGAAGALAAATLLLGFIVDRAMSTGPAESAITMSQPDAAVAVTPVADAGAASRAVPVSLVVEAKGATQVAVVGDFNGWDPTRTPMQRAGADGPWSATVLVKPGRHRYAFLVDGTTLIADPRAPKATDPDYGRETSVLMVVAP